MIDLAPFILLLAAAALTALTALGIEYHKHVKARAHIRRRLGL